MLKFVIKKKEAGWRLFDFLKKKCEGELSNRKIKMAIDLGGCSINGKIERYGNVLLHENDVVALKKKEKIPLYFEKERILFEHPDFLAYDKPAGMICDAPCLSLLRSYNQDLSFVHRLDQYTTGVLLLAKKKEAKIRLEHFFRKREVEKTYLTIVSGQLKKSSGVIKSFLGKLDEGKWGEVKGGKFAATAWKRIKQGKDCALLECFPKTGRTHQIRVHLASMGHPILGDDRYGQKTVSSCHPDHYLLHALELRFQGYVIRAPVPLHFSRFLEFHEMIGKGLPQKWLSYRRRFCIS